ncbi:MAG: ABC transporter permease [Lachnospiraceae bacterium]|nr:ABC transporter permease [Lachnospiraceae bacterium]
MQIFKLFFKIARSKIGIILLFTAVFLGFCFPMVNSSKEKLSFEESSLTVCVIDEDQSEASKSLIGEIERKNDLMELSLDGAGNGEGGLSLHDERVIMDAMYYEMLDYTLVIPEGYEERLADSGNSEEELFESYKLRDNYQASMMEQYLNNYVRCVRVYLSEGAPLTEALAKANEELSKSAKVEIVTPEESEVLDANFTDKFAVFFRLMPYILIAVMINVLSPVLLSLNRKDQKARIECSKVSVSSYLCQIFSGSGVLVVLIWALFMVSGMIIYGGFYKGLHCHLAVLNTFIFALISAVIAILITAFNPSNTVVLMLSQLIGLGMAFICGAFVPQSMLSDGVLSVAKILPAYWFERANDILAGVQIGELSDVRTCFIVELGFLLLFVILTVIFSSRKTIKFKKA